MKNLKLIIALFGLLGTLVSCEPRIEMNEGQWGDNAFIEDVKLFVYKQEDHTLEEAENGGDAVTGLQRVFKGSSEVDEISFSVVVTVPDDVDITNCGIVFRHRAKRIEPLDGAPKAGYLSDFSTGPYKYKVISADGTVREWEISFTQ